MAMRRRRASRSPAIARSATPNSAAENSPVTELFVPAGLAILFDACGEPGSASEQKPRGSSQRPFGIINQIRAFLLDRGIAVRPASTCFPVLPG